MVKDRNGNKIKIGDKVTWFDPDETARDLERVWEVYDLSDEIVFITDDYSEAEVLPSEVIVIK